VVRDMKKWFGNLRIIAADDVDVLEERQKDYGDSWKKRGGIGAMMMLARKWDRLENQVIAHGWNIFTAGEKDRRTEGVLDDIKDLRRYLLLVEGEIKFRASNPGEEQL
jgi:hypothetical protein